MTEKRRITDPETLKALSQPLRRRLYRLLIQLGPSTVGVLAKKVEGDPGQISYHLRALAKHGYIEEAPELARDKRERWWKATPGSNTWDTADFDTPEARAIADTVKAQMMADEFERAIEWEKARDEWGEPWTRIATSSESNLFLTPEETVAFNEELTALVVKWSAVGKQARAEGRVEGREVVFHFMHNFPERP
ncbi:winged helix-turn-helix domain-containing protein [Phytomonospora endophytica]|uniref:DNA-binding transcriptional ArsR family regulator n=1 Tax=Phytomonospora endophytica TaxID=714109 RepID=A0A841FKS3_9ACTN|nr:winged helix-turn-helix domain-containing protein [Phytomonospora endophytica]MBB6032550.1 DNA-binding transcriptional ArsR family regulator [Phytomonospora endophytica]GIG66300.1 transcriptional regulator [Phytomonospora endophytica]